MTLPKLLALGLVIGVAGWWWLGPRAEDAPVVALTSPAVLAAPARAVPAAVASTASSTAVVPMATPIAAAPSAPTPAPTPAPADGTGLLLPVQGITAAQLQDTFTDARSEGRVHDAIDILAPAGTPVLAVADGTVEKLFDSARGGLTVYQFEPGGRYCYYYAHLQRYADGLAEKQQVKRGQVIGYVGSTGNASPEAPHLHFEIHALGPEKQWWKGESLNPYPVLRGEQGLP
ncbi:M23 family metallopeptidase [Stenotrophomonas sp.]|uniref:M23 family metallopeptidase n=1 Tax=Stenotrophomonas sp. TaxID=69392 RepID=UPI00289A4761|nr:M23 family metallopeptidase [Stenotrophomonas sp.]